MRMRSVGLVVCIFVSSIGQSSPIEDARETGWIGARSLADISVSRKSGILGAALPLQKVWLDFHEQELCQDLDVVFSAGTDSLDVWCVIEKEKSYQKLVRLLQRVRGSHEVYLYTTRPEKKEKTPDDRDPPPSFWNNDELRDYLRDPFARDRRSPVGSDFDSEAPHEIFFKQRLRLYADSLLESEQRIARYVMDLPELATAGFGADGCAECKEQARRVCMSHLKQLDKHVKRLLDNLARALPRRKKGDLEREATPEVDSPSEALIPIYEATQRVAQRIYLFVYPENHTVAIPDLMQPSLLQSLRTLRGMIAEFEGRARMFP